MRQQRDFTLRSYRPTDLDSLFALDRVCFEEPFRFSKSTMRRFAEARNASVQIADSAGDVVGFCIVSYELDHDGLDAYITTLDVHPALRRRGVARELMTEAAAAARNAKCRRMLLHVYVNNTDAVRFYEKQSFSRERLQKSFYGPGLDAYVYEMPLVR